MKACAFIAAALSFVISSAASAETLRVGMAPEPYPPFASVDASGNWTGWEIEMMEALCKAASYECVITPIAWDGLIPALNAGQIDAIMNSMSITPERQEVIDFSNKYYNTPTVIVAAKDAGITPDQAGLTGKVIGVQVSTIHQAYVEKHFASVAAEVKAYQTQDEANQDLVAGRIDAIQADSIALDAFLASAEGQACCATMGAVADDPEVLGLGVGVGLRKGDEKLKEAFNKAIETVRADGSYDAVTAKYFASSIYGE
ncbi:transporter substrate-binding domain-containing protein [Pseudogemmobacter faecipullorum]|uniref:Transporter substrate-binding domain-containing protein n=1 Tax=Pseudogemmobacter faecipullorum TaxID=2755041 RepID=A0ABS8CQT5_9RHOB|nr:transporter substrate-binding domain-containing protein [Pseudogemmobacter faecipullorum]MCB5411555.1 transporter substrate-binding domain-containing protein [Pseudogemmobacter faecipullorum]